MYEILKELVTTTTVIKMLATEHRGEAKICSPESKRGAGLSSWLWELNHPHMCSPCACCFLPGKAVPACPPTNKGAKALTLMRGEDGNYLQRKEVF